MEDLKIFRKSLGLSINEISKKINFSSSYYEKIENGKRKPSRNFIVNFKKEFPQFDINIFFKSLLHK